jgi:hypothetical protein
MRRAPVRPTGVVARAYSRDTSARVMISGFRHPISPLGFTCRTRSKYIASFSSADGHICA